MTCLWILIMNHHVSWSWIMKNGAMFADVLDGFADVLEGTSGQA